MGRNSGGVRNSGQKRVNGKTRSKIMRDFYTAKMLPLLNKKVSVNGNGHRMDVGFTKKGNSHLFNDAMGNGKGIQLSDLTRMDKILKSAVFVKKSKSYKIRKDNIKRFYYYKVRLHGSIVYIVVAETDFMKKGRLMHDRFVYAASKNMK